MDREQTFVNLMEDSGFKAVYADRSNKPLLISLLNLVLPDDVHVHDILEYRDREQERDTIYGKKTVLDLVCSDDEGSIFSVEVQREVDWTFFKRCVYYAAGHYHGELLEGEGYDTLHPVYIIAFLKNNLKHEDESLWNSDHLISEYRFIEKRTKEFAPPTIFISFVELGRFTKTEGECRSERDRVFYWFNNSCIAKESPSCASYDPKMQSLVEATRIAAFPPAKKDIYNRDIMTELDIQYAQKKKFEAGLAEGLAEGLAKGVAQGLAEGEVQGASKTKTEIAKAMKSEGLSTDLICRMTGLSEQEVETL